jgi:xanthine dehydrogenase accessory factor
MIGGEGGIVLVRGAGDLATGTIVRLSRSGFLVAALEIERPTAVRRMAALSEAVYDGEAEVEGVCARLVGDPRELLEVVAPGLVPVLADPDCSALAEIRPFALVDAIVAKRNLGTAIRMAPIVVALGPGFKAGIDAHAVVETNRGHDLGRVLWEGSAEPDTGVPGSVGGFGAERVLRAAAAGKVRALRAIGDFVKAGDPVFELEGEERGVATSRIDGVVRGIVRDGFPAWAGLKVADIDPRARRENCFTVSDKARAVGGGVLEAILALGGRPGEAPSGSPPAPLPPRAKSARLQGRRRYRRDERDAGAY